MPERKFDDFDAHASDYRSIHTENIRVSGADSFYFAEMKVRLLKNFEQDSRLKVLDVGCGDGATELFFQRYFPAWKVTGIDISEESIRIAKNRNIPGTQFYTYEGSSMEFEDGEFDLVFMAGVLHHVSFNVHTKIVSEVNRVLKHAGVFYLFEHNPLNPLTRYLVNTCVFDKDAKLLNSSYTTGLLRKEQFKIDKKRFIIFFPRKGFLSHFIFLEKYMAWLPAGGQYFIRAIKK